MTITNSFVYNLIMSYINEQIENDLLFSSEAAEFLGISKQRLAVLEKEGRIKSIKHSNSGTLFLKQDLLNFQHKETFHSTKLKSLVGITSTSLNYYDEHKLELGDIYRITIYEYEIDAIHDGNYEKSDNSFGDRLFKLDVPLMIIKGTKNEMWLGGCTCGYSGIGPSGSVKILTELGIHKPEDTIGYKIIEYVKINNVWKLSICREHSIDDDIDKKVNMRFFSKDEKLVLLQDNDLLSNSQVINTLFMFKDFMPNPYQITLYPNRNEAENNGYFFKSYNEIHTIVFQMILEDKTGNQIWLPYYFDPRKIVYEELTIKKVFEMCNFDLPEVTKFDKLKHWFNLIIFNNC